MVNEYARQQAVSGGWEINCLSCGAALSDQQIRTLRGKFVRRASMINGRDNQQVSTETTAIGTGESPGAAISGPNCRAALNNQQIRSIQRQFARSKRRSLSASRFAKMT